MRLNCVPNMHVTALCYCKFPFHSKRRAVSSSDAHSILRPRSYARSIVATVIVSGQSPTHSPQPPASRVIAIRYTPEPLSIPRSDNPALIPSLHFFLFSPTSTQFFGPDAKETVTATTHEYCSDCHYWYRGAGAGQQRRR